jgi:PBSX family phage portal protein
MSKKQIGFDGAESTKSIVSTPDGEMEVTVHVLGKSQSPGSTSLQSQALDPFATDYTGHDILSPLYNPLTLAQLVELSPPLAQCIKAMETNIVGHGHDLVRLRSVKSEKDLPNEAWEEHKRVTRLLRYPNREESFVRLSRRLIQDYEGTGYFTVEVVRDRKADIAELHLLPSYSMRMTKKDQEWTDFMQPQRDDEGNYEDFPRRDRFRRWVQRMDGGSKVYFKEFGDPRLISAATGKEVKSTIQPANEVIALHLPSSYTTYGLPRWIANMMGVLGSRKAQSVNYLFFDNKTIPPFIIMVSGGTLKSGTVEKLKDVFEKQVKGVQNFHKALILEAIPASVGSFEGEKVSPVKIEVKPLTQFIDNDAQFLGYQEAVAVSVRGDFRIPPILLGRSDDYTRSTAIESARIGEEQVFGPERMPLEYLFQNTLLADMRIKYWNLEFLGAQTTDESSMLEAISGVKEMIPIGVVQKLVGSMLKEPAEEIPEALFTTLLGQVNAQLALAAGQGQAEGKEAPPDVVDKLMEVREQLQKRIDDTRAGAA